MVTVFAVDDDPMILTLLRAIVERPGVEFEAFESGADFEARLQEHRPDVVIIDGLLPDTSGLKLAQRVLRAPSPRPKVVFLSAFFKDLRSVRKLRTLGVDTIVHKPFEPQQLEKELEPLLAAANAPPPPDPVSRPGGPAPSPQEPARGPAGPPSLPQRRRPRPSAVDRIREAARAYQRDLPEKATEIGQCLTSGDTDGLTMGIHRLAGSAGTYGFSGLSASAAALDVELRLGGAIDAARNPIERLIADMREAASSPAPTADPEAPRWPWSVLVVGRNRALRDRLRQEFAEAGVAVDVIDDLDGLAGSMRAFVPDAVVVDLSAAGRPNREANDVMTSLPCVVLAEDPDGARTIDRDAPAVLVLDELRARFPAPFEGSVILSIDDDPTVATMCDAILAPLGFAVEWADEYEEAREAMDDRAPDVVLLDLTMPRMNGFQVCRRLRADPRWSDLPIIVMSSRSGAEDQASAVRSGANDYVVKPVAPRELIARVAARVRRRRTLAMMERLRS